MTNGNQNRTITPASPQQHGAKALVPSTASGVSTALAHASNAGETAAMAMAAKQKALVEARFTLAQHRPRDIDVVRARLQKECARPSAAASFLYLKPIGEGIEGLSIRFVEAAMAAMTNVYSDVTTIHDDAEKRIVHVEVTDAESNIAHSVDVAITKTVERRSVKDGDIVLRQRLNSYGKPVFIRLATDDEILNTVNALTSKALRTCGMRLIPGWLKDECMDWIKATIANDGAQDPDAAKRKLFDAFLEVGITVEKIKAWLGRDEVGALQPQERVSLGGILNAIKDGEATWVEVMEARDSEREKSGAKPKDGEPAKAPSKGAAAVKERIARAAAKVTGAGTTTAQAAPAAALAPRGAQPAAQGTLAGFKPLPADAQPQQPSDAVVYCTACGVEAPPDALYADGRCADCVDTGRTPEPGAGG